MYFWHRMCYTKEHIKMSLNKNHSMMVPLNGKIILLC